MSTSYSIYRFAKPTKRELSGIDYFSEHDDLQLYEVTVQTECIAVKMECLWNSDEAH